jgi:hypothetical protein
VRKYIAQLVEAFRFMAEKQIVHRDMKLSNVCLSAPGGDCRVVDLGFARQLGGAGPPSETDQSATFFEERGNRRYQSPENDGTRKIDHKDDMWALGLMVCEMLTGTTVQKLMDGDWAKVLPNYREKLEVWKSEAKVLDENLGRIAAGLLRPSPAERFGAEEVASELRKMGITLQGHRIISDEPPPFQPVGWLDQLHLAVEVPATLAEALKGVDCVSEDERDEAVKFCSKLSASKRGGLTIDEAAAIRLYTGNALYGALNERLREMAREKLLQTLHPFHGIAQLIQSAMLKLPAFGEALVFRGVREAKANLDLEYKNGQEFEWGQFTSCSTKGATAEAFATKTKFAVHSFGGRCLREFSEYPSEDEVMLPIGTRLRVSGVFIRGSPTIFLDEVHKSGRTAAQEAAAAATDATAKAAAAVTVATAEATRLRQTMRANAEGSALVHEMACWALLNALVVRAEVDMARDDRSTPLCIAA